MTTKSHQLRVLVVDDNQDAADALSRLVKHAGYEVRTAYDERAIELATDFQPHVVLLDIGMPRMDGHTMAQELRARSKLARLTIVAVTGYHDEVSRERAHRAGIDHYLLKPIESEALQQLLATEAMQAAAKA